MIIYKQGIEIIKEIRINKDTGLYQLVVNTSNGIQTLWLVNVYLNKGSKRQIIKILKASRIHT